MYLKRDYIVCWIDNLNKNVGPFVKGFCRNLAEYWFMELEWQTEIKPKIFTSHNNAIDFLKTISVDHALIINIGNDLEGDYPQFLKALDEYILDDDILIGHILDKNDRYYELHEQLYYLNVKKWKAIGCPSLGKTGIDITYNIPNKSKENHHDNYTPYWINQGSNNKLYTNVKHGHNLIAKILETDTKIRSFPEHIRKTKEYFYPNENDCNDAIYGFINKNLSSKFYPINTEQLHLEEVNVIKNLQGMITVASGLNHFKIIKHTGYTKNFKLMFCDYDEYALYMMKQIYENWDGTNYKNFIKKVDVLHNCKEMASRIDFDKFIEFFGKEDDWLSWFNLFKNNLIEINYLKLDILNFEHEFNFKILLEFLNSIEGNRLVWLSNIFCYRPTSLFKNLYKRSIVQDNLMTKFKNINELQISYGPTINGWNGGWLMSPKEYKPCALYAKELIEWPE